MHAGFQKSRLEIVKLISFTAVIFLIAGLHATQAQTRRQPTTESMTCAQTKALINELGGINLKTGQFTFDRYVSERRFCVSRNQIVRNTFVKTKDVRSCPVLVCTEPRNNQ